MSRRMPFFVVVIAALCAVSGLFIQPPGETEATAAFGRLPVLSAPVCGTTRIRLDMADAAGPAERKHYERLQGDGAMSSALPGMQALNPRVDWLELSFADCGHDAEKK